MISRTRPLPTKLAAAIIAAGVASAGTITAVPDHVALPSVSVDVANASAITDALYRLGDAINGVASGFAISADAGISLPFDAATAIAVATQAPSLAPNLLSWLVQRYVNPSIDYLPYSYAYQFKEYAIGNVASALPFPLGPAGGDDGLIINGANQIADAINAALGGLPNSGPGEAATGAFWGTDLGRVLVSANAALTAPVWALYNTAYYLGYLPANVEETVESAIRNPVEIPGLISNLVYGLLSPYSGVGLFGDLLDNVSFPLTNFPARSASSRRTS